MIPHLEERAAALAPLGWTGRDAEWLAFVCLHSGVFLRSQYLTFTGETYPNEAARFVRRCGNAAIEESWTGGGARTRLCRIVSRPVYRALGAEHIRHRRSASSAVLLRRLLSLDYVIEHPAEPWLVTEDEKVVALTAAGVPEAALPRRVYEGAAHGQGQTRYFVHKLPLALTATGATFVYVQPQRELRHAAVHAWGESHAALWAALRARGRSVAVVVVGRDPERLVGAQKVLNGWAARPPAAAPPVEDVTAELTELRAAVAAVDEAALRRAGGVSAALARLVVLEKQQEAQSAAAAVAPRITSGQTWRSVRVVG